VQRAAVLLAVRTGPSSRPLSRLHKSAPAHTRLLHTAQGAELAGYLAALRVSSEAMLRATAARPLPLVPPPLAQGKPAPSPQNNGAADQGDQL
jgi:hypothetical protein